MSNSSASQRNQPKKQASAPTDEEIVRNLCKRLVRMSSIDRAHECALNNLGTLTTELCHRVLAVKTLAQVREEIEDYLGLTKDVSTITFCKIDRNGKIEYVFRLIQPGLVPTCEVKNADYAQGLKELKALAVKSRMTIDWDTVVIKSVAPWGKHTTLTPAEQASQLRKQQRDTAQPWSLFNRTQPNC